MYEIYGQDIGNGQNVTNHAHKYFIQLRLVNGSVLFCLQHQCLILEIVFILLFMNKYQPIVLLIIISIHSMPVSSQQPQKLKRLQNLHIAAIGAVRALMGLPIQHPFETIKTWMQSENQSPSRAITHIYRSKGIRGFYAGFLVNGLRVTSKNAYRWPLTVYLISFFRKISREWGWGLGAAGTAAGLVTAMLESVIICPLERVKVWLMTSYCNIRYKSFWDWVTLRNLYDGFQPLLVKQVLSWVSFLGTQQYLKQLLYLYLGKDPKAYELSNGELAVVSIMVCLVNTVFVMPADYVKTHFQKHTTEHAQPLKLKQFILSCFRSHGIRGFYRGGLVKVIHYNINSMLTVPLMEKIIRINEE